VLLKFRPDVVITQLIDAPQLAQRAHLAGFPAAVYVHDVSLISSAAGIAKHRPNTGFLSNSAFTARQLREVFGLESSIVHNLFQPEKYRAEPLGEYVTLVNPHPQKGIDLALSLAESCPHIPFLFVGSWLHSPEKKYLRRANAVSNLTWISSTSQMRDIYRKTRILIVPSCCDETWGRVVTEAQFSGIPTLASDRGGLPEAVGPGGILLPEADLQAWRTTLGFLWNDIHQWHQFSSRALQHSARPDIQPEIVINRFIDFLEQVRIADPRSTLRSASLPRLSRKPVIATEMQGVPADE
jgi:glycosyltransferase involved in cell wall biosynthesis